MKSEYQPIISNTLQNFFSLFYERVLPFVCIAIIQEYPDQGPDPLLKQIVYSLTYLFRSVGSIPKSRLNSLGSIKTEKIFLKFQMIYFRSAKIKHFDVSDYFHKET